MLMEGEETDQVQIQMTKPSDWNTDRITLQNMGFGSIFVI